MLLFCNTTQNTESENPKVARTKTGRIIPSPKYALCDSKKLSNSKKLME